AIDRWACNIRFSIGTRLARLSVRVISPVASERTMGIMRQARGKKMKIRTAGLFSAALLLSTSSLVRAEPIVLDAVYDPTDSVNLSVSLSFPQPSLIGYV